MSFKKNKYLIKRKILSEELCVFFYNYFFIKMKVADTLLRSTYISPTDMDWGSWSDTQVPNTFSVYADIAMETCLTLLKPLMEKETGLKLIETYSYARVYKKGDILTKHTDRESCAFSTTLNIAGDEWPIFLKDTKNKKIKVVLKPGDMLVYKGCELPHWREEFKGTKCIQAFFHYNEDKKNANKCVSM